MLYTYRFRLYPTVEDEELLQKHFGCCRFIYNWMLWYRNMIYDTTGKSPSWGTTQSIIADLKKRGFKAIETFALRGSPNNPSGPVGLYLKRGFHIKNEANPNFPLMRLDL